jgi:hypothetical protein
VDEDLHEFQLSVPKLKLIGSFNDNNYPDSLNMSVAWGFWGDYSDVIGKNISTSISERSTDFHVGAYIPEPTTLLLVGLGGLFLRRKKMNSRN